MAFNLRALLYQWARMLGDGNALAKGKYAQRLARNQGHSNSGSFWNRFLR